jgi:hypothetical protein
MQAPCPSPLPDPGTVAPVREPPQPKPIPVREPGFLERHDDPEQAEELERQQDA